MRNRSTPGPVGPLARLRIHWRESEKLRFLVVGLYNTVFGFALFAGFQQWLQPRIHYLTILVLSHFIAIFNAFLSHRRITFAVQGRFFRDYFRFNLTYLGLLLFALVAMPLLVERLGFHPILANGVIVAVSTIGGFLLHKRVSFRRPPPDKAPDP